MAEESLADRIKRLQEQTKASSNQRRMDAKYSRTERMREDIRTSGRFLYQVTQGLLVLNEWLLQPLLRFLILKSKWLWKQYSKLWAYVVYRRTEDGVLLFSKTRAAAMILASFIFGWFMLIPIVECAFDAGLYVLTVHRNEHLYLFGSQELDPSTGMHNIEGADHLPWTEQDAIYFRSRNNLFNTLWSFVHHASFNPLCLPVIMPCSWYWPEYVGAAVPYGTSDCTATSYGMRARLAFKLLNTYAHLLSVECSPIDSSQIPRKQRG